jgi:hypothetical protein
VLSWQCPSCARGPAGGDVDPLGQRLVPSFVGYGRPNLCINTSLIVVVVARLRALASAAAHCCCCTAQRTRYLVASAFTEELMRPAGNQTESPEARAALRIYHVPFFLTFGLLQFSAVCLVS